MTRGLYDDAMYRFDSPQPSYWEATAGEGPPRAAQALSGNERCEVAIIGGGYTGLSAAYHLCRDHQRDVRVLEAGHLGWGASGRNGGFCSIGGDGLGCEAMLKKYGHSDTRDYYRSQVAAVDLVRHLIVEEKMDVWRQGDAEVAIACSETGFVRLKKHAEFQFRMLGLDTSVISREAFREQYFDSPLQYGAAILRPTFGMHPLRFLHRLAAGAVQRGARVHPYSEVLDWSRNDGDHVLTTRDGSVRARTVIVATNGFAPEHLHRELRGRPLPLISSIVVTRPLTSEELALQAWRTAAPAITSVNLLNYFRLLPDNRLLFGGRGSANGSDETAAENYRQLIARLHQLFPAWRGIDIDYRWHGLVCMTRRLTPAIVRLRDDPSVFFAFGYHGNGVNTAVWAGQQIAVWLCSNTSPHKAPASVPAIVQGMPARFAFASLRLHYIKMAIAMRRMADRRR